MAFEVLFNHTTPRIDLFNTTTGLLTKQITTVNRKKETSIAEVLTLAGNITSNSSDVLAYCDLPDPNQCETVRVMKTALSSISITVVIATLACIVILQKYRTFSQRIVCHILVANVLTAITVISGDGRPTLPVSSGCVAQGFFQFLFDWAEYLWMWYLTIFLFFIMVKQQNTDRFEWLYTTAGWTLPVSLACLPLTTNDYGPAGAPYCWLTNTSTGQGWRFGLYWGPVVVGMILMLVLIVYILWHVRQKRKCTSKSDPEQEKRVDEYLKPLVGYAISFLCINLIMFINRVQNAIAPPIYGFLCFHVFLVCCYGLVLSTLFFFTNGRKEFTVKKFSSGFIYHFAKIKTCQKQISTYEMSQHSSSPKATPGPTPCMPRPFYVAGGITDYEMECDTISLDSV
ncbi:cyclic AMP receptor 3-like [Watersipora subatra]|uniref:cyclic AMP receptor 3-like n=1 Tax=Watersipora subatra TaxID=2589382 RepID=UPI00355B7726